MISSFFKKLLFSRMVDVGDGEFKIFSKNFFLGSVKGFVALREELKKKNSLDILNKFGKEISKEIFDYSKKFGSDKEESIKFWLNMINLSGFGDIEIIELHNEESCAILNCKNSPMAAEYLKLAKKGKVDEILAGLIEGFFAEIFEKKVYCEEIACMAEGKKYCQFRVSSKK